MEDKFDQRTENELKKIKLALEHGMDLDKSESNPELDPEVEGQFLDYIQMWEEQAALRKTISIFDLTGQPDLKPESEISDDEIENELDQVYDLLHVNGVQLDCLCEVAPREVYRFITEELMKKETNDIRIPGMMHCYIYENFYPNHPYDIKNRCTEAIEHLTKDNRSDLVPWGFAKNILFRGQQRTKEQVNDSMMALRDSFAGITLHEFTYTDVSVTELVTEDDYEATANVTAEVRYEAFPEDGSESVVFSGTCKFHLSLEYGWWTIDMLSIPGL